MPQYGYFFDAVVQSGAADRRYNSQDFATYFAQLVGNGVFYTSSSVLRVNAEAGMDIRIAEGFAHINGRIYRLKDGLTLTVGFADGVLPRIDRVCIGLNLIERTMTIYLKAGIPSLNPVGAALTRSSELWELAIAEIRVNPGVSAITQGSITDTRLNTALCGVVTGLIKQLDTTDLDTNFKAALQELISQFTQNASNAYTEFSVNLNDSYSLFVGKADQLYTDITQTTERQHDEYVELIEGMIAELRDLLSGDIASNLQQQITTHKEDKNNPHESTASQVGAAEKEHQHKGQDIVSGILDLGSFYDD